MGSREEWGVWTSLRADAFVLGDEESLFREDAGFGEFWDRGGEEWGTGSRGRIAMSANRMSAKRWRERACVWVLGGRVSRLTEFLGG